MGFHCIDQVIGKLISETAPDATEAMTYGIPTFKLNGNLVHFAAFKNLIGFYPTPSGIEAFKEAFTEYKVSTGTVQFPLNKPIPFDLIIEVVKFRVNEQTEK